ncbi:MAG: L-glutamate gamma-semialdehyde dehydrogenase [Cytophagales bacterium]|nr:L-glutamate gamma-semialdehyde dehydrogenase [Cytophagales bacterium]
MFGTFVSPRAAVENPFSYAPGSPERESLKSCLANLKKQEQDIPMYIGGEEIRTHKVLPIRPPHEKNHLLGHFHEGGKKQVREAIKAARSAKESWVSLGWEGRASVFLRAAELLRGPYRDKINAATMLGQSKNVWQAELDAACETIDFFRFNVGFYEKIMQEQPLSSSGIWNQLEYRPLEGFVLAITPFNFTSIAANLACAPALMGNVVVWKPAYSQIYSARVIMEVLQKAGLPDGVINLIYVEGEDLGEEVFSHPAFAGLHFTGSTAVFQQLWTTVGKKISTYQNYPRLVGETGGKDFIVAHPSAEEKSLITAIIRGGFEYQGQKCSAASRVYLPEGLWNRIKPLLLEEMDQLKIGSVEDFSCLINAVIHEQAYLRIMGYLKEARRDQQIKLLHGGDGDAKQGYFIQPTLFQTTNPEHKIMAEEIFGPVVTVYVYPEKEYSKILDQIDKTSPYGLTGAVFSRDRKAIQEARIKLRYAAGNLYINDKPTGAVVGEQPFGGARASGTNDKAGSRLNLLRWTSPRTIKENLLPPEQINYPFMS